MTDRPDVIVIMTDEERAIPPYEDDAVLAWRHRTLAGRRWFDEHGVNFTRHYTGSLACVPSRPTIFTGQFPDLHGVTQTDGIGKSYNDSRMRWLRPGEVPTLGNWFRAAGYDTHYDGKWHISHADLENPDTGEILATNDDDGVVDPAAVRRYLDADPLAPYGFSGWVGPEPHGAGLANCGLRRDPLIADRVVAWLDDRYARRRAGDPAAQRPFLLVASFVNPHDIVLFPAWAMRSPLKPSPLDPRMFRPRRPPRRICATSPPHRSPSGRPTTPATARGRRSNRSTGATASATATCTTGCTPRSTARWTGCAAPSPGAAQAGQVPTTPYWSAPPTTATCWVRTAACTRSGSTSTTRPPGCRSSSPASVPRQPSHAPLTRPPRTSTWCRHCSARPGSTSTRSRPHCARRSPRCIRCRAAT